MGSQRVNDTDWRGARTGCMEWRYSTTQTIELFCYYVLVHEMDICIRDM